MEKTILSLSFSTRMQGLAIFKSNYLIDYSLKLHKESWSPQKLDIILTSLASCIEAYNIKEVVLSIPELHHQTEEFISILEAIKSEITKLELKLATYTSKEIYMALGSPVRRTRKSLMKRLVMIYPELTTYYEREETNKNKYYIKLFEAIAAGAYHWLKENNI